MSKTATVINTLPKFPIGIFSNKCEEKVTNYYIVNTLYLLRIV